MPVYTYRREDGTTFDYRQKFTDDPLTTDPTTGQTVVRVVQAAGIIFKGSGFYVNDSKGAGKSTAIPAKTGDDAAGPAASDSAVKDGAGKDGAVKDAPAKVGKDTPAAKPAEAASAPATPVPAAAAD
jgi:putative FmdB family regulatory protein